ncbi:MAG: DNA polymerase III subunit chi [Deltaproteobacteria bacterium]|nr:MAG: DNA polymerase III subunit chi [Deltaproteobacteria bacterium]
MSPRVTFYDVAPDGRWPTALRMVDGAARKGLPIIVHCADPREAHAFDEHLWTFRDEAFLPHEIANSAEELRDAEARIVIVTAEARPIPATILVQLTPASDAYARTFDHVIDLVDHRDPGLLQASRERFRAWRDAGVTVEVLKR